MSNNKTALITGYDTNVIARETAKLLNNEGYKIIAVCANKYDSDSAHENIIFMCANLFEQKSVQFLISELKNYKFDVIVNCHAALALTDDNNLRHEFFDFDYLSFDSTVRSNVTSIAAVCIGLKDNIVANGCIVNITSSAAEEGAFATISYNASKAAIKNLSMSLANNFGLYNGVRVNCVAPGWIPQSKDVVAGNIVDLANKMTPLPQYGNPTEVAYSILSLINNPYANNVSYKVDGGITSSYLMYMLESIDLRGCETAEEMQSLIETLKELKEKLKKI